MFNSTLSRRQLIHTASALVGVGGVNLSGALAQTPTPQQAALPTGVASALSGPDREARLLEVAKKEGTVTVYSSMPQDDMGALTSEFEKRYGIKAKIWRAGSEKLLQRVVLEARSNHFEMDVADTNGPEMEAMHREHLLQVCKSPFLND